MENSATAIRRSMMANDPMYHDGMRQLQDARETRLLADRLEQVTFRTAFTDDDRAFIQRCPMFFIATADAHGHPDCSYKGGLPGFVRVLDDHTLAIPDYDGNGMYRLGVHYPHLGNADLSELPPLHTQDAACRIFGICTEARVHAASPGMEDV
jgi:hypothetical protein